MHLNNDDFESLEVIALRRVIKIAHSIQDVETIAQDLGAIGFNEHEQKIIDLIIHGRYSVKDAIFVAAKAQEIDVLFGHPLLAKHSSHEDWLNEDNYRMAYTQDFAYPITDLFANFDTENNAADFQKACRIVDDYVSAQLLLCRFNLYDPVFKMTDNCGRALPDSESHDTFPDFRLIDIGELDGSLPRLLACIEQQAWQNIVGRSEYTQLPPRVQDYFNQQLKMRLTKEAVVAAWGTGQLDPPQGATTLEQSRHIYRRTHDQNIPDQLPLALWRTSHGIEKLPSADIY